MLMSHTPPTHISTSYEASHFGKRPRSGVSQCCVFPGPKAAIFANFLLSLYRVFPNGFGCRLSWSKRG
jgi:hypothetical protein